MSSLKKRDRSRSSDRFPEHDRHTGKDDRDKKRKWGHSDEDRNRSVHDKDDHHRYNHQRHRGDYSDSKHRYNDHRPRYDRRDHYRRDNNDRNHRNRRSRSNSFDHKNAKWGKSGDDNNNNNNKKGSDDKDLDKQKPNFGLSGKLTEETNTYRGVVIKYSEPPEARKPKRRWRLYPFKGDKALQTLYIHRESAYLIGRDRKVVDLPVDHPSCSKQHAVLQYRLVPFTRDDGTVGKRVRPYIIDLESANGTYINNKRIESKKYVELLEKDVIKFGYSSREYVLLHENSKDEAQDDDVKIEEQDENDIVSGIKKEEND